MRKRPSREINIFTVSFLDVLANTIGALAFLLIIAGVLVNVVVYAPPVILTEQLPEGYDQRDYVAWLAAREGMGRFHWSIAAGTAPAGLSLEAATGKLSGRIALDSGDDAQRDFALTIRCDSEAEDQQGHAKSAVHQYTLRVHRNSPVNALPLRIATEDSLPDAYVDQSFPLVLAAEGGQPPYVWTASGHVPAGLKIESSGQFTGKATEAGAFQFEIAVSTARGERMTRGVSLSVAEKHPPPPPVPPLQVLTRRLPAAVAERDYPLQLAAFGGAPPYTWRAKEAPPSWLKAAESDGSLDGKPSLTDVGEYSVSWEVTDSDGHTAATEPLALAVLPPPGPKPPPLRLKTQSLPDARVGGRYDIALAAEGGFAPFHWTVTGPEPPRGLAFSKETGILAGTPSTSGRVAFHATVGDSSGQSVSADLPLVVRPALAPLTILTDSLPPIRAGEPTHFALAASGGFPPYHWQHVSGALPSGLAFDEGAGALVGKPVEAGRWEAQFKLVDAEGSSPAESLTLPIAVLTPQGYYRLVIATKSLPVLLAGETADVTLASEGGAPPYLWDAPAGLPAGLRIEQNRLTGVPITPGRTSVTLRVTDRIGQPLTAQFPLEVRHVAPHWLAVMLGVLLACLALALWLVARALARRRPLPLRVLTASLPNARASCDYSVQLACEGGVAPHAWRVVEGELPPGMMLTADGHLSGKPFAGVGVDRTREVRFTVEVRDDRGTTAVQEL